MSSPVNIGPFEIVREVGKSELGTVYKAYDPTRKRTVALRVLPADTPQAIERSHQYLQQAKVVGVLDSPNIVTIYAAAQEEGLAYVVMEYVEGVPLDAALATQQGFSSSELLDISRQVCRGLDHAHSKGIFHPRLTPAGILTEWDGTVKILDFAANAGPLEGRTGDELRYLSPEQVQGRPPDARSNVFNWGAILYEMVTGRKAFGGSTAEGALREILEVMPPAPNEVNPRIQVGVSRVVMKALAKNPEYRFQRAGDMVSELEAECVAVRPSVPSVPHVNVPAQMETGASTTPDMSSNPSSPTSSPAATEAAGLAASAVPSGPRSRSASIPTPPTPVTPSPARSSAPAAVASPVAARSQVQETIAPPPANVAAASGPVSLTPQQIKILVGVILAALVVMVGFMVADALHARRLRAEAEAAAVAPLIGTAAPDPITAPPVPASAPVEPPPAIEIISPTEIMPSAKMHKGRHNPVAAPAAFSVGELAINSVPAGAQVQVDGSGVGFTPVAVSHLRPGPHLIVLSKPGYAAESRSAVVRAGTSTALTLSLSQLAAGASISSDPPGASIFLDGRDTGKVTPAKLVVGQGSHSVSLRRAGYLETSTSMMLNAGETFQFMPTLKPLGNAEDIKQVGKFKKLVSRGGQESAARVLVHTFPKGAQIMFNQRMMDRTSPAEFLLGAGTYEVSLTLTGYKPVHKIITVESGGRMGVNATFEK